MKPRYHRDGDPVFLVNVNDLADYVEQVKRRLEDSVGPPREDLEEIERPYRGRIFGAMDAESILANIDLKDYYADKAEGIKSYNPLDGYVSFPERLRPAKGDQDDE